MEMNNLIDRFKRNKSRRRRAGAGALTFSVLLAGTACTTEASPNPQNPMLQYKQAIRDNAYDRRLVGGDCKAPVLVETTIEDAARQSFEAETEPGSPQDLAIAMGSAILQQFELPEANRKDVNDIFVRVCVDPELTGLARSLFDNPKQPNIYMPRLPLEKNAGH